MAANTGDYMKASEDVYYSDFDYARRVDFKSGWDARTRSRSLASIEILNETISEEPCNNSPCLDATVVFKLHFKDGSTTDQREMLSKMGTDRRWRLVWLPVM